jgi:hypothetical protein
MRTLNLTGHSDFALNVTRPRRNLQKAAAHQESIEILEKRSVIQTIWLFPRACRRHRLLPCCQVARLAPFPLLLALPKRHYWQRSLEKPIHVSGRGRSKKVATRFRKRKSQLVQQTQFSAKVACATPRRLDNSGGGE